MNKLTSKDILDIISAEEDKILKSNKKIKSTLNKVKGLSEYSEVTRTTLLNTFSIDNVQAYVNIDKQLKKDKSFKHKEKGIYIKRSFGIGLGISTDGKSYKMVSHTLFTFLKELNFNPSDFELYIKDK